MTSEMTRTADEPTRVAAPTPEPEPGTAADTPQLSSNFFTSSAVSITVSLLSWSTIVARSAILPFSLVVIRGHRWFKPKANEPTIYFLSCVVLFVVLPASGLTGRKMSPKFRNSQAFGAAFALALRINDFRRPNQLPLRGLLIFFGLRLQDLRQLRRRGPQQAHQFGRWRLQKPH